MNICNPLKQRYYLLQKIGKGRAGEVFKAKDRETGQVVAIKLLHPYWKSSKNINRFKREAEYFSSLSHRNIVKLYSFEEDDYKEDNKTEENIFFVMEYVIGRKIRHHMLLSTDPIKDTLKFSIEICNALEYAHSMQVIFIDIRPGKILVTRDLEPKILFPYRLFNKIINRIPAEGLMENIQYIPPEYIYEKKLTSSGDLYCLGVTIYELLTEKLPFTDKSWFIPQVFDEPVPPTRWNPHIPPLLEQTILKLLEKNPEERIQSAEKLRESLKMILMSYEAENKID